MGAGRLASGHLVSWLLIACCCCCCCCSALVTELSEPSAPKFVSEPPAVHLITSKGGGSIGCSVREASSRVRIRWKFEELTYVNSRPQLQRSGIVPLRSEAASSSWSFYDDGGGRLVFPDAVSADRFIFDTMEKPKYKLHCEASTEGTAFVTQSRKVAPVKIANLNLYRVTLHCPSGAEGGSTVCVASIDPQLNVFNVSFARTPTHTDMSEKLIYNPDAPKFVPFGNGMNCMHITNLSAEDTKYYYTATIELRRGGSLEYFNKSASCGIRVLDDSNKAVSTKHSKSVQEYRPGMQVLLPCYCPNTRKYVWQKESVRLNVSSSAARDGSDKFAFLVPRSGSIRIRVSGPEDSGTYFCYCKGAEGRRIDLQLYRRLWTRMWVHQRQVKLGHNVTLICEAGGWPLSRALWLRNGRPLSADSDRRLRLTPPAQLLATGRGQLNITNVTLQDQGSYQCVLERDPAIGIRPYDSVQATVELVVTEMPPVNISQVPQLPQIPIDFDSLPASGSVVCSFVAPNASVRVLHDGIEVPRSQYDSYSVGRLLNVTLRYSVQELKDTGTYWVEASNKLGQAGCRFRLFPVGRNLPSVQLRPFKPSYFGVKNKMLTLRCRVLGGLNEVDAKEVRAKYPDLKFKMYQLRWNLVRTGSKEVLLMPTSHTTQALPQLDSLTLKGFEKTDGTFYCTLTHAGPADPMDGSLVKVTGVSTSTRVHIVKGVVLDSIHDQRDVEGDFAISGACKPKNTPTGDWIAWWEFRPFSRKAPVSLELGEDVTFTDIHCSNEQNEIASQCRMPLSWYSEVPTYVRDKKCEEAKLLIRKPRNKKFQGVFTCNVVSCFDRASQQKTVTFREEYAFAKDKPPNSKEVIVNTSLTVQCALEETGRPLPPVVWYSDNAMKDENRVAYADEAGGGGRILQYRNGTLHISSIKPTDKSLLCAIDVKDEKLVKSVTFNPMIRTPATVQKFEPQRLELRAGETRSVRCLVTGDRPLNITWIGHYAGGQNKECRFGRELSFLEQPHCQPEMISYQHSMHQASIVVTELDVLQFRDVNEGVRGRYSCSASNRYNSRASTQTFDVVVIERPGRTKGFVATDVETESVTLQWEPPSRMGKKEDAYYRLSFRGDGGETRLRNVSASAKSESVSGLLPGVRYVFNISAVSLPTAAAAEFCSSRRHPLKAYTEYQVRVTAANSIGYGPPVCITARTLESTPRNPPANVRCKAVGSSKVSVSWDRPDQSSVNGEITEYRVQYLPAIDVLLQDESQALEATTRSLSADIDQLLAYTNYSFSVTVANRKGRSVQSERVHCRTAAARPEPPSKIRILGVNSTSFVVSWRPTPRPNGVVRQYRLRCDCRSGCVGADRRTIDQPATAEAYYEFAVVGGLTPGAEYGCQLAAVSQAGAGDLSIIVTYVVEARPPPQIVQFEHSFLVPVKTKLRLDCTIVGDGDTTAIWPKQVPDQPTLRDLSNGSALVDVNMPGEFKYTCSNSDKSPSVTYTVIVFDPAGMKPTPYVPELLSGQRTTSSLEVVWRPRGLNMRPAEVLAAGSKARITEYKLEYKNLYTGVSGKRTLGGGSRSHLVDPVLCGSRMEFSIRAGNGFQLKSQFSRTLTLRARGSAPRRQPEAVGRQPLARVHSRGVEFNFSSVLPGDGCPPLKYFVTFSSPKAPPLTAEVAHERLADGCCFNVTDRLAAGVSYAFAVRAHNAAGNETFVGRLTTGAKGVTRPVQHPLAADAWISWQYLLAAGLVLLLLLCLAVVCTAVFCHQRKQPAYQPGAHVSSFGQGGGGGLFPEKAARVPAGKAAVPYDDEDRESVDSQGNLRAYATFDADGKEPPQRAVPYENDDSTLGTTKVRAASLTNLVVAGAGAGPYAKGRQLLLRIRFSCFPRPVAQFPISAAMTNKITNSKTSSLFTNNNCIAQY